MIKYAIAGVVASMIVFVAMMPNIQETGRLVLNIKTHNVPKSLSSFEITFEKIEIYKISTLSAYVEIPRISSTGSLESCSRSKGSYVEGSCIELNIEGYWKTFLGEPTTVDLTDPSFMEGKELGSKILDTGGYYIIRLILNVEGNQEKIRLLKAFRIYKDEVFELTLDFDVTKFMETFEESITVSGA